MIETSTAEFKRELTKDFEKEAIAFLNSKYGGVIYLGVDDSGKKVGLEDTDKTALQIKDRLKNNIEPSCMGLFDILIEGNIIKIIIASGRKKPYFLRKFGMTSKGCFIRVASASEPMSKSLVEDLFSRRVRDSLGKIRSNKSNLTFEQLKIYYEESGLKLNEKFLHNLELLTYDEKYNYIAYLMSDNNGNSIKVAKYSGVDRVDLIESNEYGYCCLIKATKSVLDKLAIENKTLTKITPKARDDKRIWNPIALREAVINAIIHNDYTREIPPKFEIFDDRLEIISAGGLSIGLDEDDFFLGYSNPTNKEIMRIYKDLEMVEQLGSGVRRIVNFYDKSIFEFRQNFLKITLPKSYEKTDEGINEGINRLLMHIKNNPSQRLSQMSEHLKVPTKTLERWVKQLKQMDLIEFRGSKKTGGYHAKKEQK